MKTRIWILVLATALAAAPSGAQESGGGSPVLRALGLPRAIQETRILGVPESDIRVILTTARRNRLPAGILTEVFERENEAIREHGPIDNFGAFVQGRLDEGLRGRDLAAAIRAEHVARGKGKGHAEGLGGTEMAGKKGGKPEGVGKSGAPGGKPESPGKSKSDDKPGTAKGKKGGPR